MLSVWYDGVHEGKRAAEEIVEKQAVAKKQKKDEGIEQAVQKQKIEAKTQKKKKVETSSSEEDSSSEEETVNTIVTMDICCLASFFLVSSSIDNKIGRNYNETLVPSVVKEL